MRNTRKEYSPAQNAALVSQVNRLCPLCLEPLFYKKKGMSYKEYEIAHIYPVNPKPSEIALLAREERLSEDVNDENNVIPLCKTCHGKFDKPRTVEEYRHLFQLKKNLLDRSGQEELWKRYEIEKEIFAIIDAIYHDPQMAVDSEIVFSPKKIDDKLDGSVSRPTQSKIKNNVREYYVFLKDQFSSLNQSNDDLSDLISLQIKTYYLKQKGMGFSQQVIFENIVSWINAKTNPRTLDAAEILVSFFVQNCEVFE